MSYDIGIIRPITDIEASKLPSGYAYKDEDGTHFVHLLEVGNYTWNIAPILMEAWGGTFTDMDRKNVKEVAEILEMIMSEMTENRNRYIALNPENGWGDYHGCLKYIKEIYTACIKSSSDCLLDVS